MNRIKIFDSTLRDGAQSAKVTFTVDDKINIVKALDRLGVSYIEAGNPSSNPKDLEFFEQVKKLKLQNARLVAFGSTRRRNIDVEQDFNVNALERAQTEAVAIFGKSWDLHVTEIIHTSLEENLRMISDTVRHFSGLGKETIYDAEHFFDAYKHNKAYALETILAAELAGASTIVLCDTNGGTFPDEIFEISQEITAMLHTEVGIHCHNDTGCAVANSLMAIRAGARQVQGTFTGFGERCGNAKLSSIIPSLELKLNYSCIPNGNLKLVTSTASYISEISNTILSSSSPYVGKNAFSHKGGMHIDGVLKNSSSFEHVNPETVGNTRQFLCSEVSGKAAIMSKLQELCPELNKDSAEVQELVDLLKRLEYRGYQFEAAAASLDLLIMKHLNKHKAFFQLENFKIIGEQLGTEYTHQSSAMVKIRVGNHIEITADEGDGPVHALDRALRKAVSKFYPALDDIRLIDYKVRVIDPKDATSSKVRVLVESTDGIHRWNTTGVSRDVINASLFALSDAIEYKLMIDYKRIEQVGN